MASSLTCSLQTGSQVERGEKEIFRELEGGGGVQTKISGTTFETEKHFGYFTPWLIVAWFRDCSVVYLVWSMEHYLFAEPVHFFI